MSTADLAVHQLHLHETLATAHGGRGCSGFGALQLLAIGTRFGTVSFMSLYFMLRIPRAYTAYFLDAAATCALCWLFLLGKQSAAFHTNVSLRAKYIHEDSKILGLFSTLLNQIKLLYGLFRQSNMQTFLEILLS